MISAEKSVIACLLMDSKSIEKVYNYLTADMFTSEFLGRIYKEFQRGYDNLYEVNMVTLEAKLINPNDCEQRENLMTFFRECVAMNVMTTSINSYGKVVLNSYKQRKCSELLCRTQITEDNIDNQIAELIKGLEALRINKDDNTLAMPDIVAKYENEYFNEDVGKNCVKFNIGAIDDILGGIEPKDVTIIAARPGVGKSALVTQLTREFISNGKRVGFYNLEMSNKQMYERFLCAISGIELTRLRRATQFLNDEEERFKKANNVLRAQKDLFISDASKTVSMIRNEAKNMNYDVIIIDYLQLLTPEINYKGNRAAEVSEISRKLKLMAQDLDVPVIVLSQLNRESEQKADREPSISELRESGSIEQDASNIMFLWNPNKDLPDKKAWAVAKQRQGRTGKGLLDFDGAHMTFSESAQSIKDIVGWKSEDESTPFD